MTTEQILLIALNALVAIAGFQIRATLKKLNRVDKKFTILTTILTGDTTFLLKHKDALSTINRIEDED